MNLNPANYPLCHKVSNLTPNRPLTYKVPKKMAFFRILRRLCWPKSPNTTSIRLQSPAVVICLLVLSACGREDSEMIARVNHDFSGNHELYSYRATPLKELGQAEAVAKKMYGKILSNVKSPSTMYMCVWRDLGHKTLRGHRPSKIFLSCSFGPEPIKRPTSLVEMAKIYNTIDRANLKATWKLENENYVMSRFEVEIIANKMSYRSQNLADDMAQIQVTQKDIEFPKDGESPFQFNLQSQLQQRRKSGGEQKPPIVSIVFSGRAEPMPRWLNY